MRLSQLIQRMLRSNRAMNAVMDINEELNGRPETIEHRWDILYRDFPEVYDAFSSFPYEPTVYSIVRDAFDLTDALVADVGSGTGKSTIGFAPHCREVIGIEPEDAMRKLAVERVEKAGVKNVAFIRGSAENTNLSDESVDFVVGITTPKNPTEAFRVLRPGGTELYVDIAPGWYGGHLNSVINHPTAEAEESFDLVNHHGFSFLDFENVQHYGTVEAMVSTYGFIFGKAVIEHIRSNQLTDITWRWRLHYRSRP